MIRSTDKMQYIICWFIAVSIDAEIAGNAALAFSRDLQDLAKAVQHRRRTLAHRQR